MSSMDTECMKQNATTAESSTHRTFVTETLPNDVLLGRGSHLVKYIGNIEFRRVIQEHKREYVLAVRHSHKDQIAREVINIVTSRNGRFLRKVDNPIELKKHHIPAHILSVWVLVETEIVVEKIKQAFRDSCKDEKPQEEDQQISSTAGFQEIHATDSLKESNSSGRNALDVKNIGSILSSSIQVMPTSQAKESEIKKSPLAKTDNSISEHHISHPFYNQGSQDSMITQHLLQYQENQRQLLERIASQQNKPPTSSENISKQAEWPIYTGNPQHQCPDNQIYHITANSKGHQHLQAQQFQLAIQSEMSQRSLQPMGSQSQYNLAVNAIPSQYLDATTDQSATRSMTWHEQAIIFRALQRLGLQPTQSQQYHSPLINSRDALFAIQHNSSLFPPLLNHNSYLRSQALSSSISTVEFSQLLCGLSPSSIIRGSSGKNDIDSMIPSELPHTANSGNNSILPTTLNVERDSTEYNSKKRSSGNHCHDVDDESATRKKVHVTKKS